MYSNSKMLARILKYAKKYLFTMIIALLINFLLSIDGFIASDFSRHEWFSFWTTYTTGVFALIVGYLAISYGNRNSERALQQQNILLLRQESDKIKAEYTHRITMHVWRLKHGYSRNTNAFANAEYL